MKKPLFLAIALSSMSFGTLAYGGDDDCYVPMSNWQTREAVRDMAQAQGWEVRRLKIDDGCYEIKGYDRSGREIEVKIDPATLAIVGFEYEDDDDKDDRKSRKLYRKKQPTGPITPLNPPKNGLFAPAN